MPSLSQAERPCRAVACSAFCITKLVKPKIPTYKLHCQALLLISNGRTGTQIHRTTPGNREIAFPPSPRSTFRAMQSVRGRQNPRGRQVCKDFVKRTLLTERLTKPSSGTISFLTCNICGPPCFGPFSVLMLPCHD